MTTTEERFTAIEANLKHTDELLGRIVEQNALIAASIIETSDNVLKLDAVVQSIGERVEMLGRYVNTAVDYLQEHEADPGAHEGDR